MPCIVCNNDQSRRLYDVLLKCQNCGFTWADLDIHNEQITKFYDNDYFCGQEYHSYLQEKAALQKNFSRDLKLISRFMPSGKLLEIGCAYGFFLDLARRYYTTTGIDISESACQYAKEELNLNVICGDFLKAELKENHYDIIVSWATIEHLQDPHIYIEKIARLLKKGGVFACSTIDIDSPLAKIQGKSWRQIHPPTHLSYFSEKTTGMLLNKYGLKQKYVSRLGEYRTVDNSIYTILVLKQKLSHFYQLLSRLKLNRGMFYLNTYDTMYIIATKAD